MAPSIVVYTSLYGDYERLLDQPVARANGIPFVCFTDRPDLRSGSWDVRHVPGPFACDPVRNSRRAKILAHEYLPEYDVSLYVDNSVELLLPPADIVDRLLPPTAGIAQIAHNFRGSVADEFSAVIEENRDTHWRLCEQFQHYETDAPEVVSGPVTCTGLLVRRHTDPLVRAAMHLWWEHVCRYSRRDQLSIDMVAARTGVTRAIHHLDIRRTDFHRWPREGLQRDHAAGLAVARDAHRDCALWGGLEPPEAHPDEAAELVAEVDRSRQRIVELESEVRVLRLRLQRLRTARNAARTEADRMRESASWRVTRPLRAVAASGRRLPPLLRRIRPRRMEPTPYGVKLLANWQDKSFKFCVSGAHGWTLPRLLEEESSPFVFVDIGANQGLFSLLAARNGHCRHVFSVEPVPSTLKLLRKNIARSRGRRRISVRPFGISDLDRSVTVSVDPGHTGLTSVDRQREGGSRESIELRTADGLARDVKQMGYPICIKIDVEGHEAVVLRELQRVGLLAEARWVFYEVSRSWSDPDELEEILRDSGFVDFAPTGQGDHFDVVARRVRSGSNSASSVTLEQ